MLERRSFLAGLVGLPLIGGGVKLIGRPTAAAVPVTPDLQALYLGWLRLEHTKLMHEIVDGWRPAYGGHYVEHAPPFCLPIAPSLIAAVGRGPASSRASVVMSAAGAPWWASEPDCTGLEERPTRKYADPHRDPFQTYDAPIGGKA